MMEYLIKFHVAYFYHFHFVSGKLGTSNISFRQRDGERLIVGMADKNKNFFLFFHDLLFFTLSKMAYFYHIFGEAPCPNKRRRDRCISRVFLFLLYPRIHAIDQ